MCVDMMQTKEKQRSKKIALSILVVFLNFFGKV
jgi:hypothetical protein